MVAYGLRFAALLAVGFFAGHSTAQADVVHMACNGKTLLPNNTVDTNSSLSLAIDLLARTVTVGGYTPVAILPASGISDTASNEVRFIGSTMQGILRGTVDRITGEANITFQLKTPKERFFKGICQPAQKLF